MNDVFGVKIVRVKKGFLANEHIKEGQYKYFIRHADFMANKPATIEKFVNVNLHSTIVTNEPIEWIDEDPNNNYIQIERGNLYSKQKNLVIV